jgi:hypothetical protein
MDNYGTHKHANVQAWLKFHPRFVCHFVSTSSSWLNLVERWCGELTRKRSRRGSFGSVGDLKQAIDEFLVAWNEAPKPFIWTATVDSIVANCHAADRLWKRFSPVAPRHGHGKAKNE